MSQSTSQELSTSEKIKVEVAQELYDELLDQLKLNGYNIIKSINIPKFFAFYGLASISVEGPVRNVRIRIYVNTAIEIVVEYYTIIAGSNSYRPVYVDLVDAPPAKEIINTVINNININLKHR